MSAQASLKAATALDHEALDSLFSRHDLSKREDYARFLIAHAAAFLPIEQALSDAGATTLDGWEANRRSDALRADLEAMGLSAPSPLAPPEFENGAAMMGGAYVLEGSRLGAKFLRKTVGESLPCNFLSAGQGMGWKNFVAQLEQSLRSSLNRALAERAARETFACFQKAAEEFGGR